MRTRFPDPAEAWTEDDARTVLDEWRRSGDSIAAFARQHGIAAPRLYWWKKRLGTASTASTLSLVPATIMSSETTLTIRLPGDVTIEVVNASASWVAELVRSLP